MFTRLRDSKSILRKSDFDDHYSAHKRYMKTVSKADQIHENVASMNMAPMAGSNGMVRSPSKAYMTSQRSTTTLPPISDLKSPRKSVPVSHTPKLNASPAVPVADENSLKIQIGGDTTSRQVAHKTPHPKALPKISSNTEQNNGGLASVNRLSLEKKDG